MTNTTFTRIDVRNASIRLFDKRTKVAQIDAPEGTTPATLEGIVAALPTDFATIYTIEQATAHLQAAIAGALARKGSVIPDQYRHQYGVDQNNGDNIAVELKDHCGGGLNDPLDLDRLAKIAAENGIDARFDEWMGKGLNPGMVRMNTGNVLRGMYRRGEEVRIGDKVWNREGAEA